MAQQQMTVFAVFVTKGEGDGYRMDELLHIFMTKELAIEFCMTNKLEDTFFDCDEDFGNGTKCHESICDEQPYYFGLRTDCHDTLTYGHCGGYIIEPIVIKS